MSTEADVDINALLSQVRGLEARNDELQSAIAAAPPKLMRLVALEAGVKGMIAAYDVLSGDRDDFERQTIAWLELRRLAKETP